MKTKSIIWIVIFVLVIAALNVVAFAGINIAGYSYGGVFDKDQGIKQGIDLAGGSIITFVAEDENLVQSKEQMDVVRSIFNARLLGKGYTENSISIDGNKITVEIPSVFDTDEAANLLGSTAQLTFRDADGNILLDGATDIKNAKYEFGPVASNSNSIPHVIVEFTPEAVEKFADATAAAVARTSEGKNYISIFMDETMISSPMVNEKIDSDSCVISGSFTPATAKDLANQIKSGQLPFKLSILTKDSIGPQLGEKALPSSITAAFWGILFIMLFMILIYRLPGLVSSIALAFYIALVAFIIGIFRVNLSLSGIAGIVLSIGMAVDANVIVFERIKDELRLGKTVGASVDAGFNRAMWAILDANITTLIAAVVLYFSNIGTVKGFAITLIIGTVVSLFTAMFVTRFLLKQIVNLNIKNRFLYGVKGESKNV